MAITCIESSNKNTSLLTFYSPVFKSIYDIGPTS